MDPADYPDVAAVGNNEMVALFELMTAGDLKPIPTTTFVAQQVLERSDLQRALRSHIEVLDDGLLVVAEEFGEFADVRRRIDLLCVDRHGQLVVVELKRTVDGGHMELQALRYAAMVSTMTFDQLVDTYERHLRRIASEDASNARARLAEFLEEAGAEDTHIDRRVRIILVSAGFDTQITTTVLWLNELYGLDIRCVRLTPYRVDDRLLLDVQQVIPLPEAEELMVRLRRKESAARAADGPDWTPYVIRTPAGSSEPLRKRRAVLAMVCALHESGVRAAEIQSVVSASRFLSVEGVLEGDELEEVLLDAHPQISEPRRWFLDEPIHEEGTTWVLTKMWGTNTVPTLDALLELAPNDGYGYQAGVSD
ncbi:endonuclease NucS domain-containing protein [Phytoactinopolyspora endophytica]|uniref:endonuclease NucS domain-containing protein n=1 Tax=Phytoactinopolyspora endophytica TaxID=1642495 RepID=UPI0013EA9B11|nr:endonuclease NucS domain-containing protein [Phytoactinopolyspora endophytica]